MSRTPSRSLRYPLVIAVTLVAMACGGAKPEEQLLTNFFRASRVRDNATLGNLTTVQFNPRTEGSVQDFEITSVGEEQRRTLQIRATREEVERTKAAEGEFARKKKAYQDANMPALLKVSQLQREKKPITGRDADTLAAWNKLTAEELATKKLSSQARQKAAAESSIAIGSLTPGGQPDVDISDMEVELISKQVTVNAQVKSPDGQTVPKTMVFTMERAVGKKAGQTIEGHWMITGLKPS
jgi:hypothetical protein